MASRGAFGFRSAKQPEKEDKKTKAPLGLSRTASITSSAPSASKLPTQSTSFFSRSKYGKAKSEMQQSPMAPSNIPTGKGQNLVNISAARSDAGRTSEAGSAPSIGGGSSGATTTIQIKSGKPRNVLRRRAPSIEQRSGYAPTESSASSYEPIPSRQYLGSKSAPGGYTDSEPRSILGVTAPQIPAASTSYQGSGLGLGSEFATSSSHMATYNSRKKPQTSSTPTLPPPTPTYAPDSGSSTRRSESPGAFSRTSTPTSMSSQSPGVPTPIKAPLRARTTSPTRSRPPVTRNRFAERLMQQEEHTVPRSTGLTAVRESGTSSSSSSTVKPESRAGSNRFGNTDLPSPQPVTPPSRTPSQREGPSQIPGFPQRKGSLKYGLDQRSQNAMRMAEPSLELRSGEVGSSRSNRSPAPPPRPSREGVPQLDVSLGAPSEQSLRLQPSAPISESRGRSSFDTERSDTESRLGPMRPTRTGLSRSPSVTSSAQPSRMPSPALAATASNLTMLPDSRSRPSSSIDTSISSSRSAKDPSPQSAGTTKSSSRFGFFTRKTRSPMEPTAAEQAEKAAKKGPAAGTGHEGYGKYARRGRSGSAATSASRGRSTSSTSIGRTPSSRKSSLTSRDEPELDDFYRDRLAPRAIIGGGQAAEGSTDVHMLRSPQSSAGTLDNTVRTMPILQSRVPRTEAYAPEPIHKLHHMNKRLPQREVDSMKAVATQPHQQGSAPTLATRRSLHRSQLFQGAEPLRIPAPINTEAVARPPMDSRDTFQSSAAQTDDISEGHEGNWLKSGKQDKSRKSPRKWNFFQRTHASPKRPPVPSAPRSDDDQGYMKERSVAVQRMQESRQVPFYALMDSSEQENIDKSSMSQLTRSNSQLNQFGSFSTTRSRDPSPVKQQSKLSLLLPSPPVVAAEFSKPQNVVAAIEPPAPTQALPVQVPEPVTLSEPRKPRLQQVGRIPRVVSKRDRIHRPPPQSFSRPRPYTPRQEDAPSSAPVLSEGEAFQEDERPALGIQTEILPQRPWGSQDSGKPASAPVRSSETSEQGIKKDEFLAFPPRIGSSVSGSSSSGILSLAATTAVVPEPGTAPEEDEVWNEYNEFLDTVESPAPLKNENINPLDKKQRKQFQPAPLHIRKDSSVTGSKTSSPEKKQASTYPPAAAAPNRGLPSPPKKSKMLEFPSTPGTISDLLAGYVDRDSTVSKHRSRSTTSRYSTSSIESEADSLAGREARGLQPASAPTMTAAQRLSQIYLRRDALLASRWLSFDRVLFSPAHFEIQSNAKDRVLVLDGLGNDEWSYYCAENYPAAMVYNLSPIARTDSAPAVQIPGVPKPPQNHKHIHHTSLGGQFPFPQGFFAAAIFRFPAATSDAAYYNAVSEFKRVLRPGGFLEMSMLDIDMVNMGSLTRRALRGIKERKHMLDPEVSLKPLSDNIQKMLGKKGFDNLNRCTLDVPVAGHVNNSRADSFDEASGKELPKLGGGGGSGSNSSERASGSIARNLAKVGRWWFSSCYELGTGRSIWEDKALVAECEARETGFKLLLCYAQKPVNKRRTRSF